MKVRPSLPDDLVRRSRLLGEDRAQHEDTRHQRDEVVADRQHEAVLVGVLATARVDGVGQHQTPPGAGVPGVLRQRLEPDAVVAELGPLRGEEKGESPPGAGKREGAHHQDDHQDDQDRHQQAGDALDAGDPEVADRGAHGDGQRLEEDRFRREREPAPQLRRAFAAQLPHDGAAEVADRPSHDGGVVGTDRRHHPRHPGADPGEALAEELPVGADGALARRLAHRPFGEDQRDRPEEEEDHPGDEERTAAVGGGDAREAPDVAGADRHAEHGEHQAPAAGKGGARHRMIASPPGGDSMPRSRLPAGSRRCGCPVSGSASGGSRRRGTSAR